MKVARPVENKRGALGREFAVEVFGHSRRRRETQSRPPFPCIERRQFEWLIPPRAVEIKMQSAIQKKLSGRARLKTGIALFRHAKIFGGLGQVRIDSQRLLILNNRL